MRHEDLWRALDTLAAEHGLTPSGLARAAGLDPTSFNRSRRVAPDGRPRWPGTETISLALAATGVTLEGFASLVGGARALARPRGGEARASMPVAVLDEAGIRGEFDAAGTPDGKGWSRREAAFGSDDPAAYGLAVETGVFRPALLRGDLVVVSPAGLVEAGDRVVAMLPEGPAVVRLLAPAGARARFETLLGVALGGIGRAEPGWLHRVVSTLH